MGAQGQVIIGVRSRLDLSRFLEPSDSEGPVAEPADDTVFLADLDESQWAVILRHCEHRRFRRGDVVVREGDADRSLAIVRAGTLGFYLDARDRVPFNVVEAPSVVGEAAFFDGKPRSGTLRALSDGELYRLTFGAFEVLAAENPFLGREILLDVGRIIALRLRRATAIGSRSAM